MADKKGSQLPTTSTITGVYIPILLPDGGSPTGYEDYRITVTDLQTGLQSQITTNIADLVTLDERTTVLEGINAVTKLPARTGAIEFSQPANSDVWKISARIYTGSPTIKIGTTLGGEEILSLTTLDTGTNDILELVQTNYTRSARTIYFTITAAVDIRIDYIQDKF